MSRTPRDSEALARWDRSISYEIPLDVAGDIIRRLVDDTQGLTEHLDQIYHTWLAHAIDGRRTSEDAPDSIRADIICAIITLEWLEQSVADGDLAIVGKHVVSGFADHGSKLLDDASRQQLSEWWRADVLAMSSTQAVPLHIATMIIGKLIPDDTPLIRFLAAAGHAWLGDALDHCRNSRWTGPKPERIGIAALCEVIKFDLKMHRWTQLDRSDPRFELAGSYFRDVTKILETGDARRVAELLDATLREHSR